MYCCYKFLKRGGEGGLKIFYGGAEKCKGGFRPPQPPPSNALVHDILLLKLRNYDVRGMVHNYFSSYLKDRYQFLSYDDIVSDKLPITFEVPQGSVLGPLLFLLYINDLNNNCTSTHPRLFADDTCILFADHDSNNLHAKLFFEINNINKWMISNKLTLNLSQSNLMIISPKKLLSEKCTLSLDFY